MGKFNVEKEKRKISLVFQCWLLVIMVFAMFSTMQFLWTTQTRLAETNAERILHLNLDDVLEDINDASDENLLEITRELAGKIDAWSAVSASDLEGLKSRYDVSEVNIVSSEGIISHSTNPQFVGFDMSSGEQAAEFLVLLDDLTEFVQRYQPLSYDDSISRKYAGVALADGGFVQVGYDADRFHRDISELVVGVTRNRHVGESGFVAVADADGLIVSSRHENEGETLASTGMSLNRNEVLESEVFVSNAFGESCYCMYELAEGYLVVAAIPMSEAALSRDISVVITGAMMMVVFAALFMVVWFLVDGLVVGTIHRVNRSLNRIARGELGTRVDVRTCEEFDQLSDDINATVSTLKRYISDAEARIDAELALAKDIQYSAIPSVFPPYPDRNEFEIWGCMETAREVGGDFYDFYFVSEDTLAFVIADVSGKGVPAAMFMMRSKTLLKNCAESGMSVEEVLTAVNDKLCASNDAGMFVTAWMGYLNVKTGEIVFANAGHNPPLLKHADGSCEFLKSRPNLVLAGMEGVRYRRCEVILQPGDAIFLYTDGVTEAVNVENELYGDPRLIETLDHCGNIPVSALCECVIGNVRAFAGEAPQADDITMLCLKWGAAR